MANTLTDTASDFSDSLLAVGLDLLPIGFAIFGADLRLVSCNQPFATLRGYSTEFCQPGTLLEDFLRLNAQRGDYGAGDIEQLVQTRIERVRHFETQTIERELSNHKILQVRYQSLPEGGLLMTYTDITGEKRREQEIAEKTAVLETTLAKLAASEERYTLAMAGANEGMYDWQSELDEIFLSERFKALIQIPGYIFTLKPHEWMKRIHPDDKRIYQRTLGSHFRGETEFFSLEFRVRRGDGNYIWVLQRGALSRNKAGRLYRMAGSIGDITARKQAEIELHQAKDAALQASQAKSAFLANMSHELRTPLNAIMGFTRLVMRRVKADLSQRQYENMEKILLSSQQLLALINDILDLSRIEAGRVEINITEVDIIELAEECLRTIEPLLKTDRVKLVKQFEQNLPSLQSDRDKMRQVLINLLGNAIKFTNQGSITLVLQQLLNDTHDPKIIFSVVDTGIGIPEDNVARIFDEFHQVDSSSTREYSGTGLGLSIAQRLTHLIGGDIRVMSTLGEGTTFTVTLPIQQMTETAGESNIYG